MTDGSFKGFLYILLTAMIAYFVLTQDFSLGKMRAETTSFTASDSGLHKSQQAAAAQPRATTSSAANAPQPKVDRIDHPSGSASEKFSSDEIAASACHTLAKVGIPSARCYYFNNRAFGYAFIVEASPLEISDKLNGVFAILGIGDRMVVKKAEAFIVFTPFPPSTELKGMAIVVEAPAMDACLEATSKDNLEATGKCLQGYMRFEPQPL